MKKKLILYFLFASIYFVFIFAPAKGNQEPLVNIKNGEVAQLVRASDS